MQRYIFFLLAFFLTLTVYAVTANVGPGIRQTSGRNVEELGNISESKEKASQPGVTEAGSHVILSNQVDGNPPVMNKGTKTSSLSGTSCKTYEGKLFEKGEAGYNDCIKTIKNDRQGIKSIP